jgi:hypothetical protein
MIERTLLRTFSVMCQAGREFMAYDLPCSTVSNNKNAFRIQANMFGSAVAFARLLSSPDRLSPLQPTSSTLSSRHTQSAQGLIDLLREWFEYLPDLAMGDQTRHILFQAVTAAEERSKLGSKAISDDFSFQVTALAGDLKLTYHDCEEYILFLATKVMPAWREWLGGIKPTELPKI